MLSFLYSTGAGDLSTTAGDSLLNNRCSQYLAVQRNRNLLANIAGSQFAELLAAFLREFQTFNSLIPLTNLSTSVL